MIMNLEQGRGTSAERARSLLGEMSLPEIERMFVELALRESGGNKSKAAELLGITTANPLRQAREDSVFRSDRSESPEE